MKWITTLLTCVLLHGVSAEEKPKAKKPRLAGVYLGKVEGELAKAILKADGMMAVYPAIEEEPQFALRGSWKLNEGMVVAKLKDPDGKEGTAILKPDQGDLILLKVIGPDGDEDVFSPPTFKRKKALADKEPAGIYVGEFDQEELQVELAAKGQVSIRSAEDPDGGVIFSGQWEPTETGLVLAVKDDCGEQAKVFLKVTDNGFVIQKVETDEGVETFFHGFRLKRQKRGGKKKDPPAAE